MRMAVIGSSLSTIGLMVMFGLLGFVPILFGTIVYQYIPWLILVSGAIIISMGLTVLFGVDLPALPMFVMRSRLSRGGISGFVLYGIAYGMTALSCSSPIFISVVVFTFSSGDFFQGIILFIFYALGMGSTLIASTLIFVFVGEPILHKFAKSVERLRKASGILLIAIGLYLFYYFAKSYWQAF